MNICICGWYFYPPLLDAVRQSRIPAYIVKNREGDAAAIPGELSEAMSESGGRGLEFGAYQQYLMKRWDGRSDVLFLQDDGEITVSALLEIQSLAERQQIDQAFIFRDEYEEFVNGGHSGRAFWMRGERLAIFKDTGGFDVDWNNTGNTEGRQANYGIALFAQKMRRIPSCSWTAIVPGVQMGRRGWIPNQAYQYKRTEGQAWGMVTPESIL